MGDYHIFPQARSSEIARYNSRPLPRIPRNHPSQVYFTQQDSASYESIIDHRIPSPFLCDQDEIQQIWSRASQHSILSDTPPSLSTGLTRSDSLGTIAEYSRSKRRRSSAQLQTLLPPALEFHYDQHAVDVVPCRLSSASTEDLKDLSFSPSPDAAKRSATPDLLRKLSTDLEGLSFAERIAQSNTASPASTAPVTPHESFSSSVLGHSPVFYNVNYSPASSTTTVDMGDLSPPPSPKTSRRSKPSNIFTSTTQGRRNISSPMPSPSYPSANSPLHPVSTNESAINPNYYPLLPVPSVVEVSRIDWDDDDLSKLARVKKSIGDLRAAAIRTKERKSERAIIAIDRPSVPPESPRPRAQRSMTAPTHPVITLHQQQAHLHRPSVPHTVSAQRIRASLPPLPTRTSSARAVPTPTTAAAAVSQLPPPKLSRKISVHAAAAVTPVRARATSDAPITQSHSLFPPSTPATSPSNRNSKQVSPISISASIGTTTPSSSPKSTATAATTISSAATAVTGRSRQSSIATASLHDKPLPTPHTALPSYSHKKRSGGGIRPALGNKRFSMLSFVSVRSTSKNHTSSTTAAKTTSRAKKPTSLAPRGGRVVGLGKLRRWFRWFNRSSAAMPAGISVSPSSVSLGGKLGKQPTKRPGSGSRTVSSQLQY